MRQSIRDARPSDLAAINDIYNHYVLNTTATFHEQPMSIEDRQGWWGEHEGRFPVLVMETTDKLLGLAADFGQPGGFRFTTR